MFVGTSVSRIFTGAIDVIIFALLPLLYLILSADLTDYRRKLLNYISEEGVKAGRRLVYIEVTFWSYCALAAIDFILSSEVADIFFLVTNMLIFFVEVVAIFNLQSDYQLVKAAMDYSDADEPAEAEPAVETLAATSAAGSEVADSIRTGAVLSEAVDPDIRRSMAGESQMLKAIEEWKALTSKPYLCESLTIADAASMMEVNPRVLSRFLNEVYRQNFNTWINHLRIEEVKRLLVEVPNMTLAQIAVETGFADSSALARHFKNIAGETTKTYRYRFISASSGQ